MENGLGKLNFKDEDRELGMLLLVYGFDFSYLTGNSLSGNVSNWMITSGNSINLFGSFSGDKTFEDRVSCLGNRSCPTNSSGSTRLNINCGGEKLRVEDKEYEGDPQPGGASYFSAVDGRWGFSNTGNFLGAGERDNYIIGQKSCGVSTDTSGLYTSARTSAISLTYYALCMPKGSYNVSLHFAEIVFTNDETYSSLGRRVFDIYIQNVLKEKDFDISARAGGVMKAIVVPYTVNLNTSILEIRLYWAGNGTTSVPTQGNYGPLISAISVEPSKLLPISNSLCV
ncbi:putative LRR receptor-like serine/threonine-protein kinase At1g53420 [Bidens hawaiensis]|uniref:putative LRR receptor-like serine/threonine-protein kinase At1g53420 n=1 Tax=Bidens hawaiensis TaxID=980011 RepID=UPI00404A000A